MKTMFNSVFKLLYKYKRVNLTLADQAIVSCANFLTGILLARFLGLEEFGRFSLVWMVILFANTLQASLVIFPMMTLASKRNEKELPEYMMAIFLQQILFSAICFLILIIAGICMATFIPSYNLYPLVLPLSVAAVAFQLQDFMRRYFITLGQVEKAIINDFISYGGQIALFIICLLMTKLTSQLSLWIIAFSSVLAAAAGMTELSRIYVSKKAIFTVIKQHWCFGSWLTVSNLSQWFGAQGILLLGGLVLGASDLGGARAVINLTAPINSFMQGLQNIVPIQASQALKNKGYSGLTTFLGRSTLLILIPLFLLVFFAVLFRSELMAYLYGSEYMTYSHLVIWQGIYVLTGVMVFSLTIYFRTIEQTRTLAMLLILVSPISLGAAFFLMNPFKEAAIFIGLLINQLLILILSFWKFLTFTSNNQELLEGKVS